MALQGPADYLSGLGGLGNLPDGLRAQTDAIATRMGLQRGALQNQGLQLQIDAAGQKQQRDQAYQQAIEGVISGRGSAEEYSRIAAAFPEYAQQAQGAWKSLDGARRASDLTQLSDIYALTINGAPDKAAAILKRRIAADEEVGEDTTHDKGVLAMLESGDKAQTERAASMLRYGVAAATGEDKLGDTYKSLMPNTENKVVGNALVRPDGTVIYQAPDRFSLSPEQRRYEDGELIAQGGPKTFAPQRGGGGKGGGGGDGYEYRIGPNGKLQRRKIG